jgi:hypothetical protein
MIQLKLIKAFGVFAIFMFLLVQPIVGQQNNNNKSNTVVVYETIVVYDTLHVFDTLKISRKYKVLPASDIKPIQPQIRINVESQNNKNNDPIQTTLLKPDTLSNKKGIVTGINQDYSAIDRFWYNRKIGISVGGGAWWIVTPFDFDNSKGKLASSFGLFLEGPLHEFIMLRGELNYTRLNPDLLIGFLNDDSYMVIDRTVDSLYQLNQISLPVKLSLSFYGLQVYGGVGYSFDFKNKKGERSLCLGGSYWFTNRFSIGVNYKIGFGKPHDVIYYAENFFSQQYQEEFKGKANSQMIDFNLYFLLSKKSKNKH